MPDAHADAPTILAAYDGHDRTPIRLAEVLAGVLEGRVHITTAYRYEPEIGTTGRVAAVRNHQHFVAARTAQEEVRRACARDVTTSVLAASRTAQTIAGVAEDVDARIVVVGADREGRVARETMRLAPCPVAIAPADELHIPATPQSVGVAFDGSPSAHVALNVAHALAVRAGGTLTVVSCTRDATRADELSAEVQRHLVFRAAKVRLEHIVRQGDPVTELRTAGTELDLLVCGSRGLSRLGERVLGSTSAALAADPPCAVVVVPQEVEDLTLGSWA